MKALLTALLLLPLGSHAYIAECTIKVIDHKSGVKTIEQAIVPPESVEFCVDGIQCFLAVHDPWKGSLLACYFDAAGNNYLGVDRRNLEETDPANKIGFGVNGQHYDVVSICTIKD
ncbi:MAG: hypothetical protein AB2669_16590 [Candidatus Thiodiazotropha endolucinida]